MSDFKTYLGDSVYVELAQPGLIKLTTNNGYPDDPRNVIFFDKEMWESLQKWYERVKLE